MRVLSSAILSIGFVGTLAACGGDDPLAGSDRSSQTSTSQRAAISAPPVATELVEAPIPSTSSTAPGTTADATATSTASTEASPLLRAAPRDPSEDPSERNAADRSGVLVVVDGCISVEDELGVVPIVWPFDATFDGTMVVTRLAEYTIGEDVLLAGGEVGDLASTVIPEQLDQAIACGESAAGTPFHAQVG